VTVYVAYTGLDVVRACSTYGLKKNAYRCSVEESEGKRSLERARRRWEVNIKTDLR
jgi:hypothetical protein